MTKMETIKERIQDLQAHVHRLGEAMKNKTIVSYEDAKRMIVTAKWGDKNLKLETPEDYTNWRNTLGCMKDILPENPEEYYSNNK